MVDVIGWILIVALMVIGMIGTVYPILPSVIAVYGSFFVYGLFFSFDKFGFWFWFIQTTIALTLFIADYVIGAWGVRKFGGSRASIIGSTIGIIIGPFVIPVVGLLVGPFLGAFLGELLIGSTPRVATNASFGALVGLFTSSFVKIVLQLFMIMFFIIWLVF